MRTSGRVLIVAAGAMLVAAMFYQVIRHSEPTSTEGAQTPVNIEALYTASFPDAEGKLQPLSQWRNQVAVVNFWASWCPPCRDEMPELSALQDKYRRRGLVILGISTDDPATLQSTLQQSPQTYTTLAADGDGLDLSMHLGNRESVLPYTLLLAKNGRVVASYWGRLDMQALEQRLLPLLP